MKRITAYLALLFLFSGCSTIQDRIQERPGVFASLSPSDQALVRSGRIRAGLSKGAVYIAWGAPDQVKQGFRNGAPFEAWVYTQTRQQFVSGYYPAFYRYGPYRYGGYWGGYGGFYGGFGDPFVAPYYSDVVPVTVPYKTAFFENGLCTGWEYIE